MKYHTLNEIKFIIFDLDGIFYRDNDSISGGKEIIEFLESNEIKYCFLTNNSCFPTETYQKKLEVCGISIDKEKIITTTSLLLSYMKQKDFKDIFVLGSSHLQEMLYKSFKRSSYNPDALVVGMDENLTLLQISEAINVMGKNSSLIAANPDKLIPKSDGYVLECGVILDIIHNITGEKAFVVGKPNEYAYDYILQTFNAKREETLMVGDTYETDIKGALGSGIKAAWIKTGNALPDNISTSEFICLESLHSLINIFEQ